MSEKEFLDELLQLKHKLQQLKDDKAQIERLYEDLVADSNQESQRQSAELERLRTDISRMKVQLKDKEQLLVGLESANQELELKNSHMSVRITELLQENSELKKENSYAASVTQQGVAPPTSIYEEREVADPRIDDGTKALKEENERLRSQLEQTKQELQQELQDVISELEAAHEQNSKLESRVGALENVSAPVSSLGEEIKGSNAPQSEKDMMIIELMSMIDDLKGQIEKSNSTQSPKRKVSFLARLWIRVKALFKRFVAMLRTFVNTFMKLPTFSSVRSGEGRPKRAGEVAKGGSATPSAKGADGPGHDSFVNDGAGNRIR